MAVQFSSMLGLQCKQMVVVVGGGVVAVVDVVHVLVLVDVVFT